MNKKEYLDHFHRLTLGEIKERTHENRWAWDVAQVIISKAGQPERFFKSWDGWYEEYYLIYTSDRFGAAIHLRKNYQIACFHAQIFGGNRTELAVTTREEGLLLYLGNMITYLRDGKTDLSGESPD